jgi:hypothetical protein
MRLKREVIKVVPMKHDFEDDYIEADKAVRFSMVWDLTRDLMAFQKDIDAESRLQRDVIAVIKK